MNLIYAYNTLKIMNLNWATRSKINLAIILFTHNIRFFLIKKKRNHFIHVRKTIHQQNSINALY